MISQNGINRMDSEIKKLKKTLDQASVYLIHEDGQLLSSAGAGGEAVGQASIIASWYSAAKMLFQCARSNFLLMGACVFSFR